MMSARLSSRLPPLVPLVLMLAPGCLFISDDAYEWRTRTADSGDAACTPTTFWVDGDGDGFGDPRGPVQACIDAQPDATVGNYGDCDDQDPTVNEYREFWRDGDGDGFGSTASSAVRACDRPTGYAEAAGDCDDRDDLVHPDAVEVCNGVDDDCDGDVDDADNSLDVETTATFYRDADGDGFGDPADPVAACAAPGGFVDNADDCLDSEALAAPGLDEVCDDGIDNDCDGTANACGRWGPAVLSDVGLPRAGAAADDRLGAALAVADMDGDGLLDLVTGAPGAAGGAGRVAMWAGPLSGAAAVDEGTVQRDGGATGDAAGAALAAGADVDGDGYGDVLIGAPGADSGAGGAWWIDGPHTGAAVLDAAAFIGGGTPGDQAGAALDFAGDVDGDGFVDLLVGGPGAGSAWLLLGATTTAPRLDAPAARVDGAGLGAAVAGVGDTDGDGLDDIALGAGLDAGAVYVVSGVLSGVVALTDLPNVRQGVGAADRVGLAVARTGDLDGDGYGDVLVGGADGAWLLHGPVTGVDTVAGAAVGFAGAGGGFGAAVASVGDVDGDGFEDLAVGAPGADAAYVFFGPHSGVRAATEADRTLTGEAGSAAGVALAGGGDLTGDATGDLVVGAPGLVEGAAWIVPGGGL